MVCQPFWADETLRLTHLLAFLKTSFLAEGNSFKQDFMTTNEWIGISKQNDDRCSAESSQWQNTIEGPRMYEGRSLKSEKLLILEEDAHSLKTQMETPRVVFLLWSCIAASEPSGFLNTGLVD